MLADFCANSNAQSIYATQIVYSKYIKKMILKKTDNYSNAESAFTNLK